VAANCEVRPAATDGVWVVTVIEVSVGAGVELPLLQAASRPARSNAKSNAMFFMREVSTYGEIVLKSNSVDEKVHGLSSHCQGFFAQAGCEIAPSNMVECLGQRKRKE
jgi:hypothetical protein